MKRFLYLPATHSEWYVQKPLPGDGVYLFGEMGTVGSEQQTRTQADRWQKAGQEVICGVKALRGTDSLATWYRADYWAEVVRMLTRIVGSERGQDVALNFEPGFVEPRYPDAQWVRRLANAAVPIIRAIDRLGWTLHVMPGIHYAFPLAIAAAVPGRLVDLDESCYALSDPKTRQVSAALRGASSWQQDLRDRQEAAELMQCGYRPGLYRTPAFDDPALQAELAVDSWYYWDANEIKAWASSGDKT